MLTNISNYKFVFRGRGGGGGGAWVDSVMSPYLTPACGSGLLSLQTAANSISVVLVKHVQTLTFSRRDIISVTVQSELSPPNLCQLHPEMRSGANWELWRRPAGWTGVKGSGGGTYKSMCVSQPWLWVSCCVSLQADCQRPCDSPRETDNLPHTRPELAADTGNQSHSKAWS